MKPSLAALVVAALLTACGDDPTTPVAEEATTTTEETTTTVAESLTDRSRVSFDGIGPVRIGMTIEEAERAAGLAMRRTQLPACVALAPTGDPQGVELIFPGGGPLEFVFARESSQVATESGISVGDDEAAVLGAHPDAEVTNRSADVHRLFVSEGKTGRRLMFEIDRGRVSVIWSGPAGSEQTTEICT